MSSESTPLFGVHYARPKCESFAVYGVALPLSVMAVALGVFTLLGKGPIVSYFHGNPSVDALSGALIGGGVTGLGLITVRFKEVAEASDLDHEAKTKLKRTVDTTKTVAEGGVLYAGHTADRAVGSVIGAAGKAGDAAVHCRG